MNRLKISLILNIINVVFVAFATFSMVTGFYFMGDDVSLQLEGFSAFQFFTFDSNLLLGIVLVAFIVYEILILKKKMDKVPHILYLLKYVSTIAVSLTMLTVIIFLSPQADNYFILFKNSNLFFHLVCPLMALIAFGFFEKDNDIKFKDTVYGIVPTFLYGIYYTTNVLVHIEGGRVAPIYDWYGFAQGGTIGMILSVIILLSPTYLISVLVYLLNKKVLNKK